MSSTPKVHHFPLLVTHPSPTPRIATILTSVTELSCACFCPLYTWTRKECPLLSACLCSSAWCCEIHPRCCVYVVHSYRRVVWSWDCTTVHWSILLWVFELCPVWSYRMYRWPLNDTGLNGTGLLPCGYFSVNILDHLFEIWDDLEKLPGEPRGLELLEK